jgi:hypothetical protein
VALWPCYVSLYDGKGVVAGWMGTNGSILPVWAKQPVPNARYYSNGFNVANGGVVARYVAPSGGANALNWTAGIVTVGGGNLAAPLHSTIAVANNQVSVTGGDIGNLTLTISAQTGTFTGSFTAPGASAKTTFKGALDQLNNLGAGWFLGSSQSGYIRLQAAP